MGWIKWLRKRNANGGENISSRGTEPVRCTLAGERFNTMLLYYQGMTLLTIDNNLGNKGSSPKRSC